MKTKEINKLTDDQLKTNLNKLKKDLFNLRFKRTSGPIEDTSKFSELKRDVAKIKTKLNKIREKWAKKNWVEK